MISPPVSLGFIRFYDEDSGVPLENITFIPLIYRRASVHRENMPQGPVSFFGWLMNCCVSDDRASGSREALSAAILFASGMATSGFTLYLAGFFHLI
jgi:hypothetical protein